VLDDPEAGGRADRVEELVLCSGKIAVDLLASPHRAPREDLAVARLEQIYPFPEEDVRTLLDRYPRLARVIWVQEEPDNMGAWSWLQPRLADLCGPLPLDFIARAANSSPAEGSYAWHAVNQEALVARALQQRAAGESAFVSPDASRKRREASGPNDQ
jgi:2-oxoglutarate dehydrogenase E1 component